MDMNRMMKEARKMQMELAKAQEEATQLTAEGTAGGGVVRAVATGENVIESITIDPSVIDPDDVEMLQDLITAAANEALRAVQEQASAKLNAVTGGLGIPGL
ncbi:MAG: YbaB/EbfC family nucleoid-associated protein [Coriobacteriales bacterium]|jgi:DNA-binding YbaB/EbfC family protein|nr:YbaB/EbfC family nucleoid-associated protein [Coriobacteriales bacterium]